MTLGRSRAQPSPGRPRVDAASPSHVVAWPRVPAWLVFVAAGLVLAVGAALVGDEDAVRPVTTATGLVTVGAMLIGIRNNQPARPRPWLLLAACTLLTTTGGVLLSLPDAPSVVGQVLTVVGSVIGLGGFVMLIRGRIPGGDRAAFLDAAIIAAGIGVLIWAFGFAPHALAAGQTSVVATIFFYPTIVALAMVARMWALPGAHRPATRMIVLLVLASMAIMAFSAIEAAAGQGSVVGPALFATFAELTFMGAAALHPSMAITPERQGVNRQPVGLRRIVALTGALLVNPVVLAIDAADGGHPDPAPYVIGGLVIGLLVVARLGDALRRLGDSLLEREALMDQLRHEALYDSLTSLPNRSFFTDRLAADFASRAIDRPLAVLLIDIDDFKLVNDTFGHDVGDQLLAAVGQRLLLTIRDGDVAARLGGDEFVITLPACANPSIPTEVAKRVLAAFAEPFAIGGRSLPVRVTIGVAVAGLDDRTADDLVRNADAAMYLAKNRGKGRFELYEPSMHASAIADLQLRTDLAAGIEASELRLHFQPVIDLRTGRTVGYEALVRWLHEGRLIPPGDFIPMAEASGLIAPLTDWVVDEACRTAAAWGGMRENPWFSVNLSPSQLVRADIVARIGRSLVTHGLAPDRLVVEITESSLLEIDVARPALVRLSAVGVRLAIDDFGTGYSALSYLAHLPIDIVKIDRSFIVALQEAGPDEAIASAIIALARRLGLTTIGEGIETASQLDQLTALGCDLGQGYHLGRPSAVEDVRPAARHRIRRPAPVKPGLDPQPPARRARTRTPGSTASEQAARRHADAGSERRSRLIDKAG
jgi:diguanylate cyclase